VEPRSPMYTVNGTTGGKGLQQDSGIVVAKARLADDESELQNVTTIFRVEPSVPQPAHYGSRLLFSKEGYLYVSLGERFFYPTRGEAQSLFSYMGKILRITTDGKPAPGNPFEGDQDREDHPLAEIWSYGHRNPQGLAVNPVTGELWESEHGPQGGDEINIIQPGKNYGWPVIAYGTNYDQSKINGSLLTEDGFWPGGKPTLKSNGGGLTVMNGMEQPAYYWDPTIAPSGMTFYSGKLIPEWKNNLFVAALAGKHLARIILEGNRVIGEERLLLDQHQRVRDVREGSDGALWVITDEADGRLIRIAPKP
jgi:aldose sugar dehydrogenase